MLIAVLSDEGAQEIFDIKDSSRVVLSKEKHNETHGPLFEGLLIVKSIDGVDVFKENSCFRMVVLTISPEANLVETLEAAKEDDGFRD